MKGFSDGHYANLKTTTGGDPMNYTSEREAYSRPEVEFTKKQKPYTSLQIVQRFFNLRASHMTLLSEVLDFFLIIKNI